MQHFKQLFCLICFVLIVQVYAQCKEPRIRRPWRTLSQAEKDLYIEAILTLKQSGVYDQFIAIHKCHRNALFSHGTSMFLPWHRWYLWQFENMLRALAPRFKCLTVPYWDWERDAGRETRSPVFGSLLGHIKPQNTSRCVNDGLFSPDKGWIVDGRCLKRQYDPKIAFIGEIALTAILSEPRYGAMSGFRIQLETRAHGAPHAWLNGDMGDFTSPNDPMFFLHHSNIDRLWSIWQDCHEYDKVSMRNVQPDQPYPFYEGSHDYTHVLDPMPFMYLNGKQEDYFRIPGKSQFPSPRDVLHIHNNEFTGMHYSYDPADNLVAVMSKLNPGFCKWDWFLEPPTINSTNRNWGITWFKQLHPSKKLPMRRPVLRSMKAVEDESTEEFPSLKRQALKGWVNVKQITPEYSLMWTANSSHVRVRVETTTPGWIALGFSPEDGAMKNCDMVVMRNTGGAISVADYWSSGYQPPSLDTVQSLTDTAGGITESGAWMEFTRPLDTNGDAQDKAIVAGDMTIVWAHGKTATLKKHELNSRGSITLALIPQETTQQSQETAQQSQETAQQSQETAQQSQETASVTTPDSTSDQPPQIDSASLLKVSGAIQISPEYHLAWKIEGKYIVFTITLTTASPVGWVGLGFQPQDHGMFNADMYISHLEGTSSPIVRDYSSFGYVTPILDSGMGSTDNVLLSSVEVQSKTVKVVFTRWLDTGDQDTDRPIVPGKMEVIWAYGAPGFKKHAFASRGITTIDFFNTNSRPCTSTCISTNGRCNDGVCECFLGWTGDKCQTPAAFPNISIAQVPSGKLNASLSRIHSKNKANPLFKNLPGSRNVDKYMYDLMSRAYDVLSNPKAALPGVQKLLEAILEKNQERTKNISLTDKLTMVLLGECALTAGSGKQYVSDDWLDKMGSTRNPLWDPPCPTGTCCSPSTMISFRQLCKGGGVAAPTCNPKTCKWEYSCKVKEDFKFGSPIAVPSFLDHSKSVPKSQMTILRYLARRARGGQTRLASSPLSMSGPKIAKPSRFLLPQNEKVQSASILSSSSLQQSSGSSFSSYPSWLWALLAVAGVVFVGMFTITVLSLKAYLRRGNRK